MGDNPHFELNYSSKTAQDIYIYIFGYDSIRLWKYLAHYDQYYVNTNYFDLMASLSSSLNEIAGKCDFR